MPPRARYALPPSLNRTQIGPQKQSSRRGYTRLRLVGAASGVPDERRAEAKPCELASRIMASTLGRLHFHVAAPIKFALPQLQANEFFQSRKGPVLACIAWRIIAFNSERLRTLTNPDVELMHGPDLPCARENRKRQVPI